MPTGDFYRGGTDLKPRPVDVEFDAKTGLVRAKRGVSVSDRPDGLDKFGGAYRVTDLPPELQIVQVGRNPHHFEIIPVSPMSMGDYEAALDRIVLVPA